MPPLDTNSLPFLIRKMLSFEFAAAFALEIDVWSTRSNVIELVGYTKEGPFKYSIAIGGAGTRENFTRRIPDIPIAISVLTDPDNTYKGEIYCTIYLTANETKIQQLARGYPWGQGGVSWPQPAGEDAGNGRFMQTAEASADPAAGVEATLTVPTGEIWIVHGAVIQLVTAATAGSRRVHLVVESPQSGSNSNRDFFGNTDQIISETKKYTFAPLGNISDETDDNDIVINIPDQLVLRPTDTISTQTTNLAAGDNFTPLKLFIEKFMMLTEQ